MTFTDRELEVLQAIRSGAKSYIRIAQVLAPAVSATTAEMHVRNIAEKLRSLPDYRDGGPMINVQLYAERTRDKAAI